VFFEFFAGPPKIPLYRIEERRPQKFADENRGCASHVVATGKVLRRVSGPLPPCWRVLDAKMIRFGNN